MKSPLLSRKQHAVEKIDGPVRRAALWTPNGQTRFPKPIRPAANARPIDVDVVVIGAGVAGLTAGRAFGKTRRHFVVLEASDRIGGRTYTDPESGEDFGAAWDHKSKGNRMTPILKKLGARRVPTFLSRYLFVYDPRLGKSRPASKAELRNFHQAEDKIEDEMRKLLASGKDATVAMFLHKVKSKWTRLYMNEAVELDDAASPTQADVRDTVEFGSDSSDNFIEGATFQRAGGSKRSRSRNATSELHGLYRAAHRVGHCKQ